MRPTMGQKKLQRFEELKTFSNVLQYPTGMQGRWKEFFKNENAITLELACGKGEYTVGLARLHAGRNFIGIDIKGNRIWRGAKTALQQGLYNAAFLRIQIDAIADYFSPGEVSEIWITFPDPQLRFSKIKKRLTHPKFLRLYKNILADNGVVHLKTDSPQLYAFTKSVIELYGLQLLADEDDVHNSEMINEELKIKTHYEQLDIAGSNKIHYLKFKINKELPADKDAELKKLLHEQQPD
ncbi:MAG TPA: tRNA (guanosine(46)-N7)-methyltransferase TrmB [Chitinophagaceae bacterium]|nr:tRNA (guanosine(46)-N7)-methyltransferase TrmB [Chitinophagaceae bacterium]